MSIWSHCAHRAAVHSPALVDLTCTCEGGRVRLAISLAKARSGSAGTWERQRDTDFPGAPAPGPAARAGAAARAGKTPPKKVIWTGFSPLPCVPSYSNPTSPPHALLGSIPRLDSPASHRFAPRTHAPPATPPPEPRLAFAFAPDRQHGISSICRGRASPCKAVGLGGRRQRLRLGQRLSQLQLERGLLPGQLHLQPLAAHLRG